MGGSVSGTLSIKQADQDPLRRSQRVMKSMCSGVMAQAISSCHDIEPGFMSIFYRAFNQIAVQKQRNTMAYRP